MKWSPDIFHFNLSTGHGRPCNTRCIWISSLAPHRLPRGDRTLPTMRLRSSTL
ncbi:hypothetical protein M404DRAFT_1005667 [Pisolithus tinctorius Marx 270]|uniref:Uncharacterized protein n=1 Tax=Pisolithus tinctorius Marx 270 TaxID=870435 RepID=A0A0C3IM07_PISTI|nr:hypothetical protein M404DRAFT_1005667 [Pisolithus tinctorius Marx 270]